MAQLGARFHGMEEVIGSIPIRSTNNPNNLAKHHEKRDTLSFFWIVLGNAAKAEFSKTSEDLLGLQTGEVSFFTPATFF